MLRRVAHGASQPVVNLAARPENAMLKKAATEAKFNLRRARMLRRRLETGSLRENSLSETEEFLLKQLNNGTLLRKANDSIIAFGHGTLKDENGRVVHLGGSTGGTTREVLDNFQQPSLTDMERFVRGS